ncbi:UNVERIFIED_CONTAM: hypothetical protein FKN15_035390 [Acipenser sinensis]
MEHHVLPSNDLPRAINCKATKNDVQHLTRKLVPTKTPIQFETVFPKQMERGDKRFW